MGSWSGIARPRSSAGGDGADDRKLRYGDVARLDSELHDEFREEDERAREGIPAEDGREEAVGLGASCRKRASSRMAPSMASTRFAASWSIESTLERANAKEPCGWPDILFELVVVRAPFHDALDPHSLIGVISMLPLQN